MKQSSNERSEDQMLALRRRMPQRARGNALTSLFIGCTALMLSACAGNKVNAPPLPNTPPVAQGQVRPDTAPVKTPTAPTVPRPSPVAQQPPPVPPNGHPFQTLQNEPLANLLPQPSDQAPVPPEASNPFGPSQPAVQFPPAQPTTPSTPTPQVTPYAPPPDLSAQPPVKRFRFESIPGWANGDHSPVLVTLRSACEKITDRAVDEGIGGAVFNGEPVFGRGGDWRPICDDARRTSDDQARSFFERWFEPVSINGAGEAQAALYTAYFEPELRGSRTRGGPYQFPIYRKPPELQRGVPFFERAQIQQGALAGRGLELFWIDDPVETFFLEIQGSGRVRLPDGQVARVGYGGKNGHSYKAIGKTLVEWGALPLEQVSLQSIKAWIRANPWRRDELLATNPSYVFFIERPELAADPSLGPIGTFGTPLPAMRSIAVDRQSYALGIPFWIDFNSPVGPMQRLVLGLDTGGAIKGPRRADFFFGSGIGPEQAAGETRERGRLIALAPTAALRRVFRAGS